MIADFRTVSQARIYTQKVIVLGREYHRPLDPTSISSLISALCSPITVVRPVFLPEKMVIKECHSAASPEQHRQYEARKGRDVPP